MSKKKDKKTWTDNLLQYTKTGNAGSCPKYHVTITFFQVYPMSQLLKTWVSFAIPESGMYSFRNR